MVTRKGFTMIEMLIVVAIIAILALIAIPNFLEAQVRSKVSRVQEDMRTISIALEAYCTDNNNYPPNNTFIIHNTTPSELTTPIAYLTTIDLMDPFTENMTDVTFGEWVRHYTYHKIATYEEALQLWGPPTDPHAPPAEAIDYTDYNKGAFEKYGKWRLLSYGPDRIIYDPIITDTKEKIANSDILYDPTNGSISFGNLVRTQKSPTGVILYNP